MRSQPLSKEHLELAFELGRCSMAIAKETSAAAVERFEELKAADTSRLDVLKIDPEYVQNLRDAIEGMCWQYGHQGMKDGRRVLFTGGSDLRFAFKLLGWEDPHDCMEVSRGCDIEGCNEWDTIGTPTPDGYKRLCSKHGQEEFKRQKEAGEGIVQRSGE
ncbi:MAG: hypothetical protein EOP84_13165 [Verrucomicrobiaceae bacterium]|nr:MAG: hypothetical protein EOP84_13165 [Verrucomicrobiaceae bacterium]